MQIPGPTPGRPYPSLCGRRPGTRSVNRLLAQLTISRTRGPSLPAGLGTSSRSRFHTPSQRGSLPGALRFTCPHSGTTSIYTEPELHSPSFSSSNGHPRSHTHMPSPGPAPPSTTASPGLTSNREAALAGGPLAQRRGDAGRRLFPLKHIKIALKRLPAARAARESTVGVIKAAFPESFIPLPLGAQTTHRMGTLGELWAIFRIVTWGTAKGFYDVSVGEAGPYGIVFLSHVTPGYNLGFLSRLLPASCVLPGVAFRRPDGSHPP